MRCQCFQISTDFITNIAGKGRPISTGNHQINFAMLHQMAADIIDNDGMGHTMLAKFPGCQTCPLIAGPGFISPDMHINAGVISFIDRRQGRAPINRRQPTGIAVGQDIYGCAIFLFGYFLDDGRAMLTNIGANLNIFITNFRCAFISSGCPISFA